MTVKIENRASLKTPRNTEKILQAVLETIPREHLRGLTRIVLVDTIVPDQRISLPSGTELPGLYHPKMGGQAPWCEIAMGALLPNTGFFKRLAARLNYKSNLAGILLSLQAQHYCLTIAHGIRKGHLEGAVRSYTEKYYESWRESQGGLRARIFKPFRPWLDRWARSLRKKYEAEQKKKQSA
ncbi:MAG TPA: hypothetical protein VNQ79_19955 [Blastocatellia bacterium]|nr:hypothetical protein [Blastocatellia bacterium]